ncbi:maltooligosyl trehalose hydrolase [Singulisphaera sp. GP187]|uniref:malto-oligosyltrehalose trehalohydrolase n=1 Tax=Singulisphaera sp. GP187 TaxID=1882752 RepID=UPI0009292651|nr:malto-oligosyltrehalose trehalohydrolase [Singulisphaera sp. GP187]SIN92689.1 maltooligosyl trehalose hydrolase [Singulisphaera sp. GP187]
MIDDPEIPSTGISSVAENQTSWRVWAPKADRVELVLGLGSDAQRFPMESIGRGFFECVTAHIETGVRYAYRLDGGPPLPDPGSRSQPDGVNAASAVWYPETFRWNEGAWGGVDRSRLVVYELHVGTFTPEGTFDALIPRVETLLELGITAIELMPVGQFPGTRNWGYDGVFPFAPQNSYGGPDALQRLVDACHRLGMAVFLDVIYNHFGPEGNVFPQFGDYLTDRYKTAWGPALNFDGQGSDAVRALVLENARQWIRDYHFDGLRLDAADQIFDRSPRPILEEIVEVVHREAARLGRPAHVFAETDLNDAPRFLLPRDRGGYSLDGQWNDDFHHAAHVVLTGETNGYYADFANGPAALAKAYECVFVNDGNYSPFRGRRHGTTATEFRGDRFLAFTQNHDQIGNRLKSDRYASSLAPSAVRLAAGILLLAPRIPLLFMGEEYGETRPFPFFCDFQEPGIIQALRDGRKAEFAYLGWEAEIPDPFAPSTRDAAVLSWSWDTAQRLGLRNLYRDLLRLRRELPALADFSHPRTRLIEGGDPNSVLAVLRGGSNPETSPEVRIYFNLGPDEQPPLEDWMTQPLLFRSEIERYGGPGSEPNSWDGRLRPHEFVLLGAG